MFLKCRKDTKSLSNYITIFIKLLKYCIIFRRNKKLDRRKIMKNIIMSSVFAMLFLALMHSAFTLLKNNNSKIIKLIRNEFLF